MGHNYLKNYKYFLENSLSHIYRDPDSSVGKKIHLNAGDPVQFLGQEDPLEKGQASAPVLLGFPFGSASKESACSVEDLGLIPGLGRSPGEGKGYPLQPTDLENFMDCIQYMGLQELDMSDFHIEIFGNKNLPQESLSSKLLTIHI